MADTVPADPLAVMTREFGSLRRALDRLMGEPLFPGRDLSDGLVDVDVIERDGKVVVVASLPGFVKEEIDVQLHDGVLTIKGEHREEKETAEGKYLRRERRYGSTSRRIAIPGVRGDVPVDAALKDGVLTVTVDAPPRPEPKRVEVRAE